MSAHVSEQSFQYVGILNGIVYRIDPSTGRSIAPVFETESFKKWSDDAEDESDSALSGGAHADGVDPIVAEDAYVERVVAVPSNLFPRSSAEPLRAGHPDLWALLVAGTCLEGSDFHTV